VQKPIPIAKKEQGLTKQVCGHAAFVAWSQTVERVRQSIGSGGILSAQQIGEGVGESSRCGTDGWRAGRCQQQFGQTIRQVIFQTGG